ncbi:MAG: hypothetical protein B7733_21900, partial [Myxococcales bacterium FL481]
MMKNRGCCTEKQSSNPAVWQEGQRLVGQVAGKLRRPLTKGSEELRRRVLQLAKRAGIESFNIFNAVDELPWDEALTEPLSEGWSEAALQVIRGTSKRELERLGVPLRRTKADPGVRDAIALRWISENSLTRAAALTDVTRQAVRAVLARGISANLAPRQ